VNEAARSEHCDVECDDREKISQGPFPERKELKQESVSKSSMGEGRQFD